MITSVAVRVGLSSKTVEYSWLSETAANIPAIEDKKDNGPAAIT